jgi:hypothetical protein
VAYEPGDLTATIFAPEIIGLTKLPREQILPHSRADRPVSSKESHVSRVPVDRFEGGQQVSG